MPATRWKFALAAAVALACLLGDPPTAVACGNPGYAYAGVVMPARVNGIRAQLTSLPLSQVDAGHVTAWVGVGNVHRAGKRGRLRAGLIATPGDEYRLYYEVKRDGVWRKRFGSTVAAGKAVRVAVVAARRPGRWRVWVNGRPFGRPVFLARSGRGMRPLATAEHWDGGTAACSRFEHRFGSVAVKTKRGARWHAPARENVVRDPGFELIRRSGPGFLVRTRGEDSAPSAPPALGPRPMVGVNYHGIWDYATDADRDIVLAKMAAAGIEWVRLDMCWCSLQNGGPGPFNAGYLARADTAVDAARSRGLSVLAVLYGTPGWANGGKPFNDPPANPDDFGAVAESLAAHFQGRVDAWEVWNEPNLAHLWTGTPEQYGALTRAAYPRFKSGDPEAQVVFGSTSGNDDGWLARAYAAGAAGHFDVLSTHPYQGVTDAPPELPDTGHIWWFTHVAAVRSLMVANGDAGKEIWLTEFGWSAHDDPLEGPNGVTQEEQADYLIRTFDLVRRSYPFVTSVFWYNERDTISGNLREDNFGLLRRDHSEKPVYAVLRDYLLTHPAPGP